MRKYLLLFLLSTMIAGCEQKKEVEYKSQEINYHVENSNSKKSLFLIHGFGDNYNSFSQLFKTFDTLNFKYIYLDLPGMGENKDIECSISELNEILTLIYNQEKTEKNYLIGHSMGGLVALLSITNNHFFDKVIVVEPSITEPDYNFFKYIQEEPTGIGIDSFIYKQRELSGYLIDYSKSLKKSNRNALKIYAKDVYENFWTYHDTILKSNISFIYVFGQNSSGIDKRKELGQYSNIDTISFKGAEHWVHYDAKNDFINLLINELK